MAWPRATRSSNASTDRIPVQLLSSLRDWLHELRLQKVRTLSTVMGIAWGTFGVVGILAFGTGLEDLMRERAEGLGRGVVIAWGQRTTRPWGGYPAGRRVLITEEDALAVRARVPVLEALSPEFIRRDRVQLGERLLTVVVSGVHPDYATLRSMVPSPGGRFLDDRDQEEARRVAFLGDGIARHLFEGEDPIGGTIQILGTPFTVVGVLTPKLQDSDYEGTDDGRVCIPASAYQRLFGERYVDYLVYAARKRDENAAATAEVYRVLGQRLEFDPADRDTLSVWDTTQYDHIRETSFLAMDTLITLACVLTLLVGGIGVGNLMFLLVRRRTREIGLRMALGARPRWIQQEVLSQAVVLVATGGAAGFGAAWLLSFLIGISPFTAALGVPRISTTLGLGVVLVLAVIGLLAGWFPARRASGLDPVRALSE